MGVQLSSEVKFVTPLTESGGGILMIIRTNPLDLGPGTKFRICDVTRDRRKGEVVTTGALMTKGQGHQATFTNSRGVVRPIPLSSGQKFVLQSDLEPRPHVVLAGLHLQTA